MAKSFRSYERKFKRAMRKSTGDGAIKAARELRKQARRKVNRKFIKKKRVRRGGERVTIEEKTGASKPGEPPKRRTGRGWRSIKAKRSGFGAARTFSDKRLAKHMSMYEFTPDTTVKRPWLSPALEENQAALMQIMATPPKRTIRRGR